MISKRSVKIGQNYGKTRLPCNQIVASLNQTYTSNSFLTSAAWPFATRTVRPCRFVSCNIRDPFFPEIVVKHLNSCFCKMLAILAAVKTKKEGNRWWAAPLLDGKWHYRPTLQRLLPQFPGDLLSESCDMQNRSTILILLFTATLAVGALTLWRSVNDNEAVERFRSLSIRTVYDLKHSVPSVIDPTSLVYGGISLFAIIIIVLVLRAALRARSRPRNG